VIAAIAVAFIRHDRAAAAGHHAAPAKAAEPVASGASLAVAAK
jgi:hypothetical protein